MIDIQNLSFQIGVRTLFKNVTLLLQPQKRYGVVGPNGAGKSTFLKVLAGEEKTDGGAVQTPKQAQIGFLRQDHFQYENWNIIDVVIAGNQKLSDALREKDSIFSKEHLSDQDGMRLGTLEEIIFHEQGYEAPARAAILLNGVGIDQKYHDQPLSVLSGGYKLRVLLAQVLFHNPDIMLLDEPTNHLDLISITWLENYLIHSFQGVLVYVSHDRDFLNRLSTDILDIDYETITKYPGDYEHFLKTKTAVSEQKEHLRATQEKKVESLQSFVDRFGAKASKAKQAASKQKMIDRIELVDIPESCQDKPFFNFVFDQQSGKQVLKASHIDKQFEEKIVLKNIHLSIHRGDRCAIIGANGMGKSTLLKIVMKQLSPDQGEFQWQEQARIAYFAQDFQHDMEGAETVLAWLSDQFSDIPEQKIRQTLGQVLFSGDTVKKRVNRLSGGEAARLMLAKIILQKANVLVLDEPTNHLDMQAVDALTESLQQYKGTVLFVSHNRFFIDRIATRVFAITPNHGLQEYQGNYSDYLEKLGKDYLSR